MNQTNTSLTLRRSSRVPTSIPVLVTSLDPKSHFSEVCETLVVNAHGCAMRSRTKLETGVRVNFHSREGRDTTAQVVSCQPLGSDTQSWILAATLDRPDNFWGLRNCPKDWVAAAIPSLPVPSQAAQAPRPANGASSQPSQTVRPQLSEADVTRIIAESLRPIQAEAAALKEKIQRRETNPSRFDVSLSSIPPELEQQLEARLRKELEPKLLQEARQQAAQLLNAAQVAIGQKTKEAHEQVSRALADERRAFEQRGQEISARISASAQERVGAGLNEFQKKLVDGGTQLKRLSQELLEFLQASLDEHQDARRAELDQFRTSITAESSRLQELAERLNGRLAKLDDAVRALESGLDHRLNEMCSRTIKQMRGELESAADAVLKDFTNRGAKALGDDLAEGRKKLEHAQTQIVASASESLDLQTKNALHTFEQSMQNLAGVSVERWRLRLVNGLSALAKSLDEES